MSSRGFIELEEGVSIDTVSQRLIKENVDLQTQKKIFDLKLDAGPFKAKYDTTGRYLYLAGQKGFFAQTDWKYGKVLSERTTNEEVLDFTPLHNVKLSAAARKGFTYIVDSSGVDIHRVQSQPNPLFLQFLPHHFLLAAVSRDSSISWVDITTGERVSRLFDNSPRCMSFAQNPWNSLVSCSFVNGRISMMTPNSDTPAVKILAHSGECYAHAYTRDGKYMASVGSDRLLKIWDSRNTFEAVVAKKLPYVAKHIDISQTGLLAVSAGRRVNIYDIKGNFEEPYLVHKMQRSDIHSLKFCNAEDVLGIGHDHGFSSIVVPGAGDPEIDTYFKNPYVNKNITREHEIKQLLEKLPSDTIVLDPSAIGQLSKRVEVPAHILEGKLKKADMEVKNYNVRNKTLKMAKVREQKRRDAVRDHVEAVRQEDVKKSSDDFLLEGRRDRTEKTNEKSVSQKRREDPLSRFK